jgi:hypothetical protein
LRLTKKSKNNGKLWDIADILKYLYVVLSFVVTTSSIHDAQAYPQLIVFRYSIKHHLVANFPKNTLAYHEFPCIQVARRRADNTGHQTTPPTARLGFIQAPIFLNEEIRRASEQTSPQVARAAGFTRKRDEGGGSGSGSSLIRRFSF